MQCEVGERCLHQTHKDLDPNQTRVKAEQFQNGLLGMPLAAGKFHFQYLKFIKKKLISTSSLSFHRILFFYAKKKM